MARTCAITPLMMLIGRACARVSVSGQSSACASLEPHICNACRHKSDELGRAFSAACRPRFSAISKTPFLNGLSRALVGSPGGVSQQPCRFGIKVKCAALRSGIGIQSRGRPWSQVVVVPSISLEIYPSTRRRVTGGEKFSSSEASKCYIRRMLGPCPTTAGYKLAGLVLALCPRASPECPPEPTAFK